MSDSIPRSMSPDLLRKLHALAERRCAHLIELQQSGRWARYYSRDGMIANMRDAAESAGNWQRLCDAPAAPDIVTG